MSSGISCNKVYHFVFKTQHATNYYIVNNSRMPIHTSERKVCLQSAGFERPRELDMHVTYSIILITVTMIYIP